MRTIFKSCAFTYSIVFFIFLIVSSATAEVSLTVTLDHADWLYAVGESVEFTVAAQEDGKPLDGKVTWSIQLEKMPDFFSGETALENGKLVLRSHGLDRPGFLRCAARMEVEGKEYRALATAGFEPEKIEPTTPMPADFRDYWRKELKTMRDNVPLDPKLEKMDHESNDSVDVFHINYNLGGSRFYGMLSVPKSDGPFPALLRVPGAGIRPYRADLEWPAKGIIHLSVGIHGIPVNLEQRLYDDLRAGALANYPEFNLDDRERYYYHRVFLGCARAVDFLFSLDKFDKKNLGIQGGSQGGALSIITAGLDERIRYVECMYPAMCDHYGYLRGRAGGWPHLFVPGKTNTWKSDKFETAPYYDVVNFARILTVPVYMGFGYNDETCPPTSMFAAYNAIPGEKELLIVKELGHRVSERLNDPMDAWMLKQLTE
ncbi:MAG: acetylxylan esterase [Candidatus Omnitrophota bacterium]|nr:MAG: acetylxylan esterase [Candidatus Omnitrophota bacterium]